MSIDNIAKVLAGTDRLLNEMGNIGFYPNAWKKFKNVWLNMDRCIKCGREFKCIEELMRTSCVRCNKSFVE